MEYFLANIGVFAYILKVILTSLLHLKILKEQIQITKLKKSNPCQSM